MKTLMLLRHAKSSWDNALLSDHDRPLNERGRHDAPRMGKALKGYDLVPDVIITSTAVRAADTAEAVALAAGYDGAIRTTGRLYHASPDTYLEIAGGLDDAVSSVLMVGHNPGLEELVEDLSGHAERMPTAALAVFAVNVASWRDLSLDSSFKLVHLLLPKAL